MKIKDFEVKTIVDSVLDVDDSSRRVKNVLNTMEVKDFDNDIIALNAFDKTIKERGPKGKNFIWHLTDHTPSLKTAVAKFSEIYVEGNSLIGVTIIPKTTWGDDVLELYKTGNINQHSIGFKTMESEPRKDHTFIKDIMLFEGSSVLWGANEFTNNVSVGKSLAKDDVEKEIEQITKDLSNFTKLFSKGHFSDETFELLEIREAQLTTRFKQLFEILSESATGPTLTVTLPEKRKRSWNNIPNFLNFLADEPVHKAAS